MSAAAVSRFYATGKRKNSIARVWMMPGSGKITINDRTSDQYFGRDVLKMIIRQPFEVTGRPAPSGTASPRRFSKWTPRPRASCARKGCSPAIPGRRNARSTDRRAPAPGSSSRRDNSGQRGAFPARFPGEGKRSHRRCAPCVERSREGEDAFPFFLIPTDSGS
jgi:hypothetical protein